MKTNSMQNLAIVYHRGNVYRINFVFMNKDDAFNLIKNSNIIDIKKEHYKFQWNCIHSK